MKEYIVDSFLTLRDNKDGEGWESGVYLICNKDRKKYYVGQGIQPNQRVFQHFNGSGNGDIYVDYKNGDEFTIRFYPFNPHQFIDLNELEYHLIRIYEADKTGYNRKAGNRTRQSVNF